MRLIKNLGSDESHMFLTAGNSPQRPRQVGSSPASQS